MSDCPWCAQRLPKNFDKNELKKKRQRATLKRMQAQGIRVGRPPVSQVKAKEVEDMLKAGMTKVQIAEALGVSRMTVYRVIRRGDL